MRLFLSCITVIAACALTGCINPPWPVLDRQLGMLNGQPVNAAFASLGYPTNEGKVAGRKYYVWSSSNATWFPSSSTTTGFGTVGGTPFNYNQTTFGDGEIAQLHCTIRIFVNARDIIVDHDYTGNQGACARYAERLDASYQSGF